MRASREHYFRFASASLILTTLLAILEPARAAAAQAEPKPPELGKVKSIAESQHEIVILLLEKKDFSKALVEANKIFQMSWPEDQEPILLKELLYLSDRFMHNEQATLSLQLLETNQKMFRKVGSQASIWKEKGYLYKKMNQTDKALDCFREAQRLDKSRKN